MLRQKLTLKARALRYLSIREYSPAELERKLQPYAAEGDDLAALLAWLKERGFLSETRFVETYVRRQSARYGNARVLMELERHGVSGSALSHAEAELQDSEFERAQSVWKKKFGTAPSDMREKARQFRFLQQRGFSGMVIRKVLKDADFSDDER